MVERDELLIFKLNNQKDTFKLLLILYNKGKIYSSKVRRLGMNDRTIIRAREVLENFGLIKITSEEGSRRLYYELTPKGYRVVELLLDLERFLFIDWVSFLVF